MQMTTRHRGFTLLEVLIALLVFSLGLLGMAGLLIVSVKTNHSAYLRTQASFLAQSMADRMRSNMPHVWTADLRRCLSDRRYRPVHRRRRLHASERRDSRQGRMEHTADRPACRTQRRSSRACRPPA